MIPVDTAPERSALPCQLLRFTLGRQSYAVEIGAVQEIQQVSGMTCLPMLPAFVRGVMNLRGSVVPVIDLAARLGLGATRITPRTCVVLLELPDPAPAEEQAEGGHAEPAARRSSGPQRLGMLVDAVHEVIDLPLCELSAVPPLGTRLHPDFLGHMARVRGEVVEVLALERALDVEQLAGLIDHHVRSQSSAAAPYSPHAHARAAALALVA